MVNGPPKIESLGKFYPSLGILQNFIMGLGVSDLVSVRHIYIYIYAFLLSHYVHFFVLGLDFKMSVSASRRVLDFTIRHPLYLHFQKNNSNIPEQTAVFLSL